MVGVANQRITGLVKDALFCTLRLECDNCKYMNDIRGISMKLRLYRAFDGTQFVLPPTTVTTQSTAPNTRQNGISVRFNRLSRRFRTPAFRHPRGD
jgi:hypothetical protein